MPDQPQVSDLQISFNELVSEANGFFDRAEAALSGIPRDTLRWERTEGDHFWVQLSTPLQNEAFTHVNRLVTISGQIAVAMRNAPLVAEADQRDIMNGTKGMRAALLLRHFRSWDTEVLHDEGTVLGVQPPGQSDDEPFPPENARRAFADWQARILAILELVAASQELTTGGLPSTSSAEPTRYRPNTAFIMMWMDPSQPDLDDVSDAVKEVFSTFDIRAVRADDIEHGDLITQRILNEISTAEFLFADLTGARPSVYYEVGYAHALDRRVILFRKGGTGLHFDLAGHNCPEYENLRELREKLTRRLEHITNKRPRGGSAAPAREAHT